MRFMDATAWQLSFRGRSSATAESGRKTRRRARAQNKSWNLRPEGSRIRSHEIVVPFHETFAGLENAETLVLVHAPRRDQRLLADDTLAFDFAVFADGIVNQPA